MRIIPNSFSVFAVRKGNTLVDRNGLPILDLNPDCVFFRHLQENVEVELRVRQTDSIERLQEEIAKVEEDIEAAYTRKYELIRRMNRALEMKE